MYVVTYVVVGVHATILGFLKLIFMAHFQLGSFLIGPKYNCTPS